MPMLDIKVDPQGGSILSSQQPLRVSKVFRVPLGLYDINTLF